MNALEPTVQTVLSYNILEGLQGSQVQIDVFVSWVRQLDPDIIFYQELNDFTEDSLQEMARRYDHPYAVRMVEPGYRVGISSRHPMMHVQRVSAGLRLGYIYAEILGIHVFAIHLDPFREDDRLKEIDIILEHVRTLPPDARLMMVGDFNALAERDKASYGGADFAAAARLAAQTDWQLRFDATNRVLHAGFTDAYALFNTGFKRSWPTAKRIIAIDDGCRIDYAFVNEILRNQCISAEIVHDPITRFLSDHYPLVLKMKP